MFGQAGDWIIVPSHWPAALADPTRMSASTFAVYKSRDTNNGCWGWDVLDAEMPGVSVAWSPISQDDAVARALEVVRSERIRSAWEMEERRIKALGQTATRPVRADMSREGGYVLHAYCLCGGANGGKAEFDTVADAARWLDDQPETPWAWCPLGPRTVHVGYDRQVGTITRSLRLPSGMAAVEWTSPVLRYRGVTWGSALLGQVTA
ncbi:hypothetical protein [Streptomyces sp. NPDC051572]|uniref:hypothetical protein n=1 Tax=Streptomyces sp. NPDC051572 TaxID=3155802 RepID=UPI00344B35EA